ncbi:MAG: secondary thiamine-phosphate synthase enzyme YjbQ [Pseudomonadales bacterium]
MQQCSFAVQAPAQGLFEITGELNRQLAKMAASAGLAQLFIRHTSASLIVQENADPAVQHDLERFLNRLVPERQSLYTHIQEGPDDMPAHIKGALTATSLSLPVAAGQLALGTWQGVYLWEHRKVPRSRELILSLLD